jgi:hypothetical protein
MKPGAWETWRSLAEVLKWWGLCTLLCWGFLWALWYFWLS